MARNGGYRMPHRGLLMALKLGNVNIMSQPAQAPGCRWSESARIYPSKGDPSPPAGRGSGHRPRTGSISWGSDYPDGIATTLLIKLSALTACREAVPSRGTNLDLNFPDLMLNKSLPPMERGKMVNSKRKKSKITSNSNTGHNGFFFLYFLLIFLFLYNISL